MMSVVAQLGKKPIQIRIADPAVAPTFSKFGGVTGSITSGDLFYIEDNRISTDIYVTLYLTNTPELGYCCSNLALKVGVYLENNADGWESACWHGEPIPESFITLHKSQVSFALAGYANYKVTLKGGVFHRSVNTNSVIPSPQFYMTAD